MSWIFHEPFEPAIHVRRAVAPPNVARSAFSPSRRLSASLIAGDAFADGPWTGQRRAYAPPPTAAAVRPYSSAGRVLASLLAGGVFDEGAFVDRRAPFSPGQPTPGPDGGRTASFVVVVTGKGDDPYGNEGLAANAGQGLGALALSILAVEALATFGGRSASRVV